jgi:hypothetical protein
MMGLVELNEWKLLYLTTENYPDNMVMLRKDLARFIRLSARKICKACIDVFAQSTYNVDDLYKMCRNIYRSGTKRRNTWLRNLGKKKKGIHAV